MKINLNNCQAKFDQKLITFYNFNIQTRGWVHSDEDSSEESDFEVDDLISMSGLRKQKGQNLDEMVVTAAKEMGKELFAELSLEERKAKLDAMVS